MFKNNTDKLMTQHRSETLKTYIDSSMILPDDDECIELLQLGSSQRAKCWPGDCKTVLPTDADLLELVLLSVPLKSETKYK